MGNNILYAYMAGFVDAEGSISIVSTGKRKQAVVQLSISNCNFKIIEMFYKEFGGKIRERTPKNKNWKNIFEWRILSLKAVSVIENLLPFIVIKKQQALVAIKVQQLKKDRSISPLQNSDKYQEKQSVILNLKNRCLELNKRGVSIYQPEQPQEIPHIFKENKCYLFSYMAGLIDADGYISILCNKKRNYITTKISFCNCNKEIVGLFSTEFGGSIQVKKMKNTAWRTNYEWSKTSKKAVEIIEKIKEFLVLKKEQSGLVIEAQNLKSDCRYIRRWHKEQCDQKLGKLHVLLDKCRALNKRGTDAYKQHYN